MLSDAVEDQEQYRHGADDTSGPQPLVQKPEPFEYLIA